MSWHGPSAPRVEGIATKSRVVASCASNPASTASRIFCWLAFITFVFLAQSLLETRSKHNLAGTPVPPDRFQNRHAAHTVAADPRPYGDTDARKSQRHVSHHRRADRRRRRARLQSLPDQKTARGPADQSRPQRAEDREQVRNAGLTITRALTTAL